MATFWNQPEICRIGSGGEIRDAQTEKNHFEEINIFSDFEYFRKNSVERSKTTMKPIDYSAFKSINFGLSNQV